VGALIVQRYICTRKLNIG